LSDRISFTIEGMLLFVSADYLDGVHNFDVTVVPGGTTQLTRIGVYDTVGEIKAGISYHFNLYQGKRKKDSKWFTDKGDFENEFFFNKRHNKVEKLTNPYTNEEIMKSEKYKKFKIKFPQKTKR
jgi:hypothetical protein